MGLDGVELVMAFEEAFGVPITDADSEKMLTPRAVIDFIEIRRGTGAKAPCMTRRAFHGIRERVMRMGFERNVIRPGVSLANFFPEAGRQRLWAEARGGYSKLQWPELVRPARLQNLIGVLPLVVASATLIGTFRTMFPHVLGAFGLAGLAAFASWVLALFATRGQRTSFPGLCSIRDLAVRVATTGLDSMLRPDEKPTRDEIAATVKQLTIEQLGIREADYDEDKEFVRDFGVD